MEMNALSLTEPHRWVANQQPSLVASVLHSISVDLRCSLPSGELVRLCRALENALPEQSNPVVQIASAYETEGSATIAFETAIVASTLMGKRVLFIDTATTHQGAASLLAEAATTSLDALLHGHGVLAEALISVAGTNLFYAVLRGREGGVAFANFDAIDNLLDFLRPYFDMILINSPGILGDAFGTALAKLADGAIVVVEAEATRGPVALETRRLIQTNGGHVIGAVLNRRRFHIPQKLYRFLYRRGL